jgi:hypothetical protein
LIVGDLAGGKDKEKGGSGLISPFGIDLAIMLGWTPYLGLRKTLRKNKICKPMLMGKK